MLERTGEPLGLEHSSEHSIARHAVLTDLATAGYALHWVDGIWYIRHVQRDEDVAWAETLDTIIEQAQAIILGVDPNGDAPVTSD